MATRVFRLFILLASFFVFGYGGYLVYKKQVFPITHVSFEIEGGEGIYISNLQALRAKENSFSLLGSYGGEEWADLLTLISGVLSPEIKVSAQINISEHQTILSVQGVEKEQLKSIHGLEISIVNHKAELNGKSWDYWENESYIVFSDQGIYPKIIKKSILPYVGNADFFYQGLDGSVESIKLTDKLKFSTYIQDEPLLKGKAINALPMLANCPATSQFIQFFGSTRFDSDITTLQNIDTVSHASWIEDQIIFIRKDSFEILMGRQNDEQMLKNLIEEAVLQVANDSLLKPSIYFNNIEIIPFFANWNWSSLCASISSGMHYFAQYNNSVFLANDLKAMYWVLSSIQLGKTFSEVDLKYKIPTRVNFLEIDRDDEGIRVLSKTWIGKNRSINFSVLMNASSQLNKYQLLADFDDVNPAKWLLTKGDKTDLTILMIDDKKIKAFSLKGDLLWTIETEVEMKTIPVLIDVNNDDINELVVVAGNKMHVYKISNQTKQELYIEASSSILKFCHVQGKHKSGYVLQTNKGLEVYDAKGKSLVKDVLNNAKIGNVKQWYTQNENGEPILFVQSKLDSLYLIKLFEFNSSISRMRVAHNEKIAPFFIYGEDQQTKILNYEDGFIKMKYLNGLGGDSIQITTDIIVEKNYWVKNGSNWLLGLEGYDKIEFFNKHGLSELKIIKPEPNLMFLSGGWTEEGIFVFLNKENQELYFIDEYGNLLMKNPIEYNNLLAIANHLVITKNQNRIQVYNLE